MAQRDLVDLWSSLPLSGDPARVRDVLLQFFPDLLTSYGDTAAVLGADWEFPEFDVKSRFKQQARQED